jgi:hypothetical protein
MWFLANQRARYALFRAPADTRTLDLTTRRGGWRVVGVNTLQAGKAH